MSSTNKGGRPPRAKGEKLQRINLTLRPSVMFGLEVIARDRGTSLSQAAEFAIASLIRGYSVGWGGKEESLQKIVNDLGAVDFWGKEFVASGERSVEQERARQQIDVMHAMPPNLLSKEEQFVLDCLGEAKHEKGREKTAKGDLVTVSIHLDDAIRVLEAAKEGFALGKSVEEVVEPLRPFKTPPPQ